MTHFAYIDPGAGSLVIQALIAAIASIPFVFRSALRTGLQRLRRRQPSTDVPSEAGGETE